MGNIPSYSSKRPAIVGTPDANLRVQASGADFGAATGAALAGLGGELRASARDVSAVVDQRRQSQVAAGVADFDFSPTLTGLKTAAGPGASGYHDTVVNAYDDAVTKYADKYEDADVRRKVIETLKSRRPDVAAAASTYEYNAGIDKDTNDLNTALNSVTNKVRSDPATFDTALVDGSKIIDALPKSTADAKATLKLALTTNLASNRFEAMIDRARTPDEIGAIRSELGDKTWLDRFAPEAYNKIKNQLDAAEKTLGTKMSSVVKSTIANLKDRNKGVLSLIPLTEMRLAAKDVAEYGSEEDQREFAIIKSDQDIYRTEGRMPAIEIEKEKVSAVNATFNKTGVTNFLLTKLKNHPPRYITDMRPELQTRLAAFFNDAPPEIKDILRITSGARNLADQTRIFRTARKGMAARPGYSVHEDGKAADIGTTTSDLRGLPKNVIAYIEDNAPKYGLVVSPWSKGDKSSPTYEPWHVELADARGGPRLPSTSKIRGPVNFRPLFETNGAKYGVPATILSAVGMAESSFSADVISGARRSPKGASGMMQIMPGTAARYKVDPNNPEQAVDGAAHYLSDLYKMFKSWPMAVAAYNWGEGNLSDWIKKGSNPSSMPRETRDYVAKVMGSGDTALEMSGSAGVDTATFYRNRARDTMLAEKRTAFAPTGDMMTYSAGIGNVTLGGISTPEEVATRGKQALEVASYNRIPLTEATPLTSGEVDELTKAVKEGSAEQSVKVLTDLRNLGPDMAKAAYRQLGATDPVWSYAASVYDEDGGVTATNIIRGQKRIDGPTGDKDFLAKAGVKPELYLPALGEVMGNGFYDLKNVAGVQAAALAHYAQTAIPAGKGWDEDAFKASVNAVLGGRVGTVNAQQVLLPKGVTAPKLEQALDNMTLADWTSMAVSSMPPRFADGSTPTADELADEARLSAINGQGDYRVLMADNAPLTTGRVGSSGSAEAFIVHMDATKIDEIAARRAPETLPTLTVNPDGTTVWTPAIARDPNAPINPQPFMPSGDDGIDNPATALQLGGPLVAKPDAEWLDSPTVPDLVAPELGDTWKDMTKAERRDAVKNLYFKIRARQRKAAGK